MKKVGKLFLNVVIILFICYIIKDFFGLFYWRMTQFSKYDLEWVQPAVKFQDALFVSESGDSAFLSIEHPYINQETNPFFIRSSGGAMAVSLANAGYDFTVKIDSLVFNGWFQIKMDHYLEVSASFDKLSFNNLPIDKVLESIEIGNQKIENCIVFNKTDNNSSPNRNLGYRGIETFIISKNDGLIYFKLQDGTEFMRQFLASGRAGHQP